MKKFLILPLVVTALSVCTFVSSVSAQGLGCPLELLYTNGTVWAYDGVCFARRESAGVAQQLQHLKLFTSVAPWKQDVRALAGVRLQISSRGGPLHLQEQLLAEERLLPKLQTMSRFS